MTRLGQLERTYPGIPAPVLLKADLIFSGLQVNAALVAAGVGAIPHFRRVEVDGATRTIPYFVHIPDGAGGELLVLVRPNPASPYRVEAAPAGGYLLLEDGRPAGSVRPHPKPGWRVRAEAQGLARAAVGMESHGDMLVANLTPACEYWPEPGEEASHRCLFCGYGAVSQRSECLGQVRGAPLATPAALAEFSQALAGSREATRHLYLVGGSLRNRDDEGRRYEEIARAAVAAVAAYRGSIGCGSQALPRAWSERLRAAGAGYACFNLEIWDEELWRKVCPGKARFVGREEWMQGLIDAVAVYGRGAAFSAFVAGAELVPPLGHATPAQAIASNVAGADWMLSRGIVPIYSPMSPTIASEYSRAASADLDYFLRLNLETRRLRRRHGLPVDTRYICGGCTYAQLECDMDRLAG